MWLNDFKQYLLPLEKFPKKIQKILISVPLLSCPRSAPLWDESLLYLTTGLREITVFTNKSLFYDTILNCRLNTGSEPAFQEHCEISRSSVDISRDESPLVSRAVAVFLGFLGCWTPNKEAPHNFIHLIVFSWWCLFRKASHESFKHRNLKYDVKSK